MLFLLLLLLMLLFRRVAYYAPPTEEAEAVLRQELISEDISWELMAMRTANTDDLSSSDLGGCACCLLPPLFSCHAASLYSLLSDGYDRVRAFSPLGVVIFVGMDSPDLPLAVLAELARTAEDGAAALHPATDGAPSVEQQSVS